MAKIDPAFEALIQHGLKRLEDMRAGADRRILESAEVVKELREQVIGLAHFGSTFPQGLLDQTDVMCVGRFGFERPCPVRDPRVQFEYESNVMVPVIGRNFEFKGPYDAILIMRKAVRS